MNKFKTVFLGVIFLIVIVIVIVGINVQKRSSESKTGSKQVTITYWDYPQWPGLDNTDSSAPFDAYPKAKIAEFEKLNPNIKVNFELLTWQGGGQKLDVAVASRQSPDIVYLAPVTAFKYARQKALIPINDYLFPEEKDDFYETILETGRMENNYYLWPWFNVPTAVIANYDLFEELGITHLLPKGDRSWTMDDFVKAAKAATVDRNGDGKPDVYGFVLEGSGRTYFNNMWVYAFGGSLYSKDDREFTLDDPNGLKALEFLRDLIFEHKVVPVGSGGMNSATATTMFIEGKVAMMMDSPALLSKIKVEAEKPFTPYVVQFPYLPSRKPVSFLQSGGFVVFRSDNKDREKAAMKFVQFLTNKKNIKSAQYLNVFPARRSAGTLYSNDENMKVFGRMIEYGIKGGLGWTNPNAGEASLVIAPMYQAVFSGQKDPKTALNEAAKQVRKILAK